MSDDRGFLLHVLRELHRRGQYLRDAQRRAAKDRTPATGAAARKAAEAFDEALVDARRILEREGRT